MSTERLGTNGLTIGMKQFYSRMLLDRTIPIFVHANPAWGDQTGIPRQGGRSVEFRRYTRPSAATTVLTEGTPPSETNLTVENVQVTVDQYGAFNRYSEVLDLQNFDPYLAQTSEVFAEQMADTVDQVVRDIITAGTTIQYANVATTRGGASGVGSGMVINYAEIREAVRTLRNSNVKPFMIDGRELYIGIVNPYTEEDFFADADINAAMLHAAPRAGDNPLFVGRIADFHGVRWVNTTNAKVQSSLGLSNMNVQQTLIFGQGFYALVDYQAMRPGIIVHPPGSSGISDPLNQAGTIGWKTAIASAILDQNRGVRIEHAATGDQALKT